MLHIHTEKRLLQIFVALACIVPLSAGLAGMVEGIALLDPSAADAGSHVRYLSGLLFAIGAAFAASIPRIERNGPRIRLLTAIVLTGGLGRLMGLFLMRQHGIPALAPLAMELLVTPLLCLWQYSLAVRLGTK